MPSDALQQARPAAAIFVTSNCWWGGHALRCEHQLLLDPKGGGTIPLPGSTGKQYHEAPAATR
jgi:hypothetical protein